MVGFESSEKEHAERELLRGRSAKTGVAAVGDPLCESFEAEDNAEYQLC